MVTYDREDKGVLQDLASLLGNNSKKWDLLDHSKKNMWMISTLALLSEDMEAAYRIRSPGPNPWCSSSRI